MTDPELAVYTIGHSNRSLEEFVSLLRRYHIDLVVDVRRFPRSRRHPHFDSEPLRRALAERGIGYEHRAELGGRRSTRLPDSPNTGWRVEGFNAYADHLRTVEARKALAEVADRAKRQRLALMCAEALPWRCHRQIIADQLVASGIGVLHILGDGQLREHTLTQFARVDADGLVYYPGQPLLPFAGGQEDCPAESNDVRTTDLEQVTPGTGWHDLLGELTGQVTLVIGRVASGKTSFVRWTAARLTEQGARVAVITCDMGQPLVGPPGAMWASLGKPRSVWKGWFIGDNTPAGNLVPVVTGATLLTQTVQDAGANTVLIDTTGLVDGPIGRLLKLHKALATRARRAVLFGDDDVVVSIAQLLEQAGTRCVRLPRSEHARDRDWEERRQFREQRFRDYFATASLSLYSNDQIVTMHWEPGLSPMTAALAPGRLCGLLDEGFLCIGLGIVESLAPGGLFVRTPVPADEVHCVVLGRLQLARDGRELGKLRP